MTSPKDNMRGALFMVGAMIAFTLNDVCLKALGDEIPLMQALFVRGIGVSVILGLAVHLRGGFQLGALTADRRILVWRVASEVAASLLFLTALFNMPIANVVAILQALPLAITLAAALFLGEVVGWRRFMAIGIGFLGVLLIVRPGGEGFTVYSLYALLAIGAMVVRDLTTRKLSPSIPTETIAFVTATGLTVFAGLASMSGDWVPMDGIARWQLAGSTVAISCAYLFSVSTMRVGDVGFVAPFRYTSLVVALILGLVVFGEWPDGLTLLGSAVVVVTGLFTLWRERQLLGRSP